jgi:3-oxoacyl-[acyl-carrier protein] reductase
VTRVAIVTGASRGIGLAIAERFGSAGDTVVGVSRAEADVGDADAVAQLVERAAAAGPVRVLVNNAAAHSLEAVEQVEPARWDEVVRTNLRGPFLLSQAVIPHMRAAGGGAIVNLASVAALAGPAYAAAYGAAKAGLVNFTRALAAEVAGDGIRVNAVSPGMVDTDMGRWVLDNWLPGADGDAAIAALQGRWETPTEIAELVFWLASDEASAVSGAHVVADLGQTARLV